jgi:multidrug efflux system outer membrane protein
MRPRISIGKRKILDFFLQILPFCSSCSCASALSPHTAAVKIFPSILVLSLLLTGCTTVGPDHKSPQMDLPASFSNNGIQWKRTSTPKVYENSRWWRVFGDSTLNELAAATASQNLSLQAASARLREARALSRSSRTAVLPSLDFNGDVSRRKFIFGQGGNLQINTFSLPLDLAYEVDLWGKVRRQVEGANAREAVAQASFVATQLTLTADTAQTYWALRGLDADRALLVSSIALRKESLALVEARFRAGTVNALDVSRGQTEVANLEAELIGVDRNRSELVNALAVLTGRNAGSFSVAAQAKIPKPPSIPAGLPADLLLRRPDLYAAERTVAAANADIGVAKAAYYPSLSLRLGGGLSALDFEKLFRADATIWSLGSSLTYPIIGQKKIKADYDAAVARHQAASLDYKQSVLVALREAEDGLTGLDFLGRQEEAQNKAVVAAEKTLDISRKRFEAGLVSFLEVVDAERTLLSTQRQAASVRAQRLAVSVNLIKALGGSW